MLWADLLVPPNPDGLDRQLCEPHEAVENRVLGGQSVQSPQENGGSGLGAVLVSSASPVVVGPLNPALEAGVAAPKVLDTTLEQTDIKCHTLVIYL